MDINLLLSHWSWSYFSYRPPYTHLELGTVAGMFVFYLFIRHVRSN